ncbi:MAG: sugar transferase [Flavobacteriia bacterium]|nr:sugar transferase [Flavobacteriia bacterium]
MRLFDYQKESIKVSYFAEKPSANIVHRFFKIRNLSSFYPYIGKHFFLSYQLINKIRYINNYFKTVNSYIKKEEFFLLYFETFQARKKRLHYKKLLIFKYFLIFFDFIINRVFPKIKGLNYLYYKMLKNKRVLSKAEILGRLVANGFEIVHFENIDGFCYVLSKKKEENYGNATSSYGIIFKMNRIGLGGKYFSLYKIRTMHSYSEYLQDYMINQEGFDVNGKLKNDFRVTPWGHFFRRLWIDELPQIINLIKRDIKLVGLRPVSKSYYEILPEDLKKARIKYRPGLIAPYVCLNYPTTFEGIIESERKYIQDKSKNPYFTDIKYFFFAVYNILIKGKRSA